MIIAVISGWGDWMNKKLHEVPHYKQLYCTAWGVSQDRKWGVQPSPHHSGHFGFTGQALYRGRGRCRGRGREEPRAPVLVPRLRIRILLTTLAHTSQGHQPVGRLKKFICLEHLRELPVITIIGKYSTVYSTQLNQGRLKFNGMLKCNT